jgi:hypothetical protein
MLIRFLVIALMSVPLVAHAGDGFDMPGSDYANFAASSPFTCRNSCGGDTRCQAWAWVKPGVQGPNAQCWLKDRVPKMVKNDCCSSGPRRSISARDLKAEDHTDRPGADYKNFMIDNWAGCEATCNDEGRCVAWTYARPGLQGPRGHCWLKTAVPHPVENKQTVSGVKFKELPGKFD